MSIKCPECGKEVNEVYTVCPWCGCPLGGNDGASSAAENFNLGIQKINDERLLNFRKKKMSSVKESQIRKMIKRGRH